MFAGHPDPQRPAAATNAARCGCAAASDHVPAADWHLLFAAVCDRLQASARAAQPADPLVPVVLDAVQALCSLQLQLGPPRAAEVGLRAVPGGGNPDPCGPA